MRLVWSQKGCFKIFDSLVIWLPLIGPWLWLVHVFFGIGRSSVAASLTYLGEYHDTFDTHSTKNLLHLAILDKFKVLFSKKPFYFSKNPNFVCFEKSFHGKFYTIWWEKISRSETNEHRLTTQLANIGWKIVPFKRKIFLPYFINMGKIILFWREREQILRRVQNVTPSILSNWDRL